MVRNIHLSNMKPCGPVSQIFCHEVVLRVLGDFVAERVFQKDWNTIYRKLYVDCP